MCSFLGAYVCSLLFGIADLLQGLSVLIFYSIEQYIHRHCTYAHAVDYCEYFNFKSNHSTRTKIGLGEGLICMSISGLLIYLVVKRKGMLVWGWLVKPIVVACLNLYFVTVWLIQRGRYYLRQDTEDEIYQELLFIYFGAATAALQLILALWFCCSAGGFSYHIRKRQRSLTSSCETKV